MEGYSDNGGGVLKAKSMKVKIGKRREEKLQRDLGKIFPYFLKKNLYFDNVISVECFLILSWKCEETNVTDKPSMSTNDWLSPNDLFHT